MKKPNTNQVYVAFSGGCDSTALLIWAKENFPEVTALHFNHGWPASQKIQDHAQAVADQLKIQCIIGKATSPCLSETSARTARFEFFDELPADSTILLGHNLEEQIETVIYQLSRGSKNPTIKKDNTRKGKNGTLHLHRPFLNTSKTELKKICQNAKVSWFEDPSNEDTQHVRNKIRHEILPLIKGLNSKAFEHWGEFFNDPTPQTHKEEEYSKITTLKEIPCELLDEYSTTTVGIILHQWLKHNNVQGINRSHTKACIEVARGIRPGWSLPKGKMLRRSKQILSIH